MHNLCENQMICVAILALSWSCTQSQPHNRVYGALSFVRNTLGKTKSTHFIFSTFTESDFYLSAVFMHVIFFVFVFVSSVRLRGPLFMYDLTHAINSSLSLFIRILRFSFGFHLILYIVLNRKFYHAKCLLPIYLFIRLLVWSVWLWPLSLLLL